MTTRLPLEVPKVCTNKHCRSDDGLVWTLTTRLAWSAPHNGLLSTHDVVPVAMLACEYCSETVLLVEDDAIHELIADGLGVQPNRNK